MNLMLYLLMLIIPAIAQIYVTSSYSKYVKKKNSKGLTGYDVAKEILEKNGLGSLYIVETPGKMTDHYDPTRKVVKLSTEVYNGDSIASLAIAAHECGHAIQDKDNYFFLKLRSFIFPMVSIATKLSYVLIILGMILEFFDLIMVGIVLVGAGLLFQLITLPVELNASKRALKIINDLKLCDGKTHDGAKVMLRSAALTYLAGVLSSALEVLRLVLIFTNRRD